jgi:hypothetical protein
MNLYGMGHIKPQKEDGQEMKGGPQQMSMRVRRWKKKLSSNS